MTMAAWLVFALLTPILWAVGNIIEKFQIDKVFKHWLSYFTTAYVLWSSLVFSILLFDFNSIVSSFDPSYAALAFASGLVGTVGVVFYLKAVSKEDASRVVPLSYTSVVFAAVFAFLFLQETFSFPKYAGMALLVAGAVVVSYKKIGGCRFTFTRVAPLVLFSAFMEAISDLLDKFFLLRFDFWSLIFWAYFGGLVVIAAIFAKKSNHVHLPKISELVGNGKKGMWALLLATMVIYFAADVTWLVALSQAPLSLVVMLNTTSPMFVLVFALILTVFTPKILKEEVNKSIVSLKLAAVVLIMLGAYLIVV